MKLNMKYKWCILTILLLGSLVLLGICVADTQFGSFHWKHAAQRDLLKIYNTLKDNHPGYHNSDDPLFRKWLEEGYAASKEKSSTVCSYVDYISTLRFFLKGFHDGHVGLIDSQAALNIPPGKKPSRREYAAQKIDSENVLITLPSFEPQEHEQALLYAMNKDMHQYKNYQAIIFDLRGNTGGNSDYGSEIIKGLYGTDYYNQRIAQMHKKSNQYIEWRASDDNYAYIQDFEKQLLKEKVSAECMSWITSVRKGVGESVRAGNLLYTEQELVDEQLVNGNHQNVVHAQIYIITDSSCASACLNFIDELRAMGPVVQIGSTTGADTDYMEIRKVPLKVTGVQFCFPIKMYRNRPRKANQPYIPDYPWTEPLNDVHSIQMMINSIH